MPMTPAMITITFPAGSCSAQPTNFCTASPPLLLLLPPSISPAANTASAA